MDQDETATDLAAKMTAKFGVPMQVRFDFSTFRLVCTRVDGHKLTECMDQAFAALLRPLGGRRVEMSVR